MFSYSDDPQCHLVSNCLQLEARDVHSRILRRLYCLLLHELSQNSKALDDETIVSIIKERHRSLNMNDLPNRVKALTSAGARYARITEVLGSGMLFLLGQNVSNSV